MYAKSNSVIVLETPEERARIHALKQRIWNSTKLQEHVRELFRKEILEQANRYSEDVDYLRTRRDDFLSKPWVVRKFLDWILVDTPGKLPELFSRKILVSWGWKHRGLATNLLDLPDGEIDENLLGLLLGTEQADEPDLSKFVNVSYLGYESVTSQGHQNWTPERTAEPGKIYSYDVYIRLADKHCKYSM